MKEKIGRQGEGGRANAAGKRDHGRATRVTARSQCPRFSAQTCWPLLAASSAVGVCSRVGKTSAQDVQGQTRTPRSLWVPRSVAALGRGGGRPSSQPEPGGLAGALSAAQGPCPHPASGNQASLSHWPLASFIQSGQEEATLSGRFLGPPADRASCEGVASGAAAVETGVVLPQHSKQRKCPSAVAA